MASFVVGIMDNMCLGNSMVFKGFDGKKLLRSTGIINTPSGMNYSNVSLPFASFKAKV